MNIRNKVGIGNKIHISIKQTKTTISYIYFLSILTSMQTDFKYINDKSIYNKKILSINMQNQVRPKQEIRSHSTISPSVCGEVTNSIFFLHFHTDIYECCDFVALRVNTNQTRPNT